MQISRQWQHGEMQQAFKIADCTEEVGAHKLVFSKEPLTFETVSPN